MIKYIVKATAKEQTAKDYLKRHEGISSTLWKKIKKCDTFFVNGIKTRPTRAVVKPNDVIEYEIFCESTVIPVNMPLSIQYEDDYLLIADKPAGMLTHPLTFEPEQTLANGVMYHYQQTGQHIGCHPLYRLDRNTSGLVTFAKIPQLQHQLANNHQKLQRYYYAIVHGIPEKMQDRINAPIGRQENSIILHCVCDTGKIAITNYQVLQTYKDYSLVKLWLETGRTHQIRVHMAYIGHPLLGDDLYGGSRDLISRHALHAYALNFVHPFPFTKDNLNNTEINITSELPADMAKLL